MNPAPFSAQVVADRIARIEDRLGVFMYLIEGEDHALLVDTGFGVDDLRGFVRSLTSKPITVVLTHGHVDHAFGAHAFDRVYLHPADIDVMRTHVDPALEAHAEASAQGRPVQRLPDPASFRTLEVGTSFDLGGLRVEVHDGRGHTPGSITLLVVEERVLITGDAANQGTFLFLPESSTITEYRSMLEALAHRLEGRYDRVLVSHLSGEMPVTVLSDLIALCDSILTRTDDAQPFEFMGLRGLAARHVDPSLPIPSIANIVYDPDRITRRSPTSKSSTTPGNSAAAGPAVATVHAQERT
ncbi:MBL fold metallo-hydrolase [Microbacterium sp. B2969]|uniref:MBL fold metallo-hydrolase n=1 Tax=Microbacterium alkaliflavum TaxID=3248839 RepID=A0ABW7QDE2_9MICO